MKIELMFCRRVGRHPARWWQDSRVGSASARSSGPSKRRAQAHRSRLIAQPVVWRGRPRAQQLDNVGRAGRQWRIRANIWHARTSTRWICHIPDDELSRRCGIVCLPKIVVPHRFSSGPAAAALSAGPNFLPIESVRDSPIAFETPFHDACCAFTWFQTTIRRTLQFR